jgi:hypothetical protein
VEITGKALNVEVWAALKRNFIVQIREDWNQSRRISERDSVDGNDAIHPNATIHTSHDKEIFFIIFFSNVTTTCPLWTSWFPLSVVAEV